MTPAPGERTPVAIIGAGPVGLVAALLLARYGVPSEVFERHPAPYPLPRAVHMDDEVMRILQAVEEPPTLSRPAAGPPSACSSSTPSTASWPAFCATTP
ncbi:FAD-dependent monooxygenase [Streptomyces sp. L-9-10]|uniref:FAD-dependent monooxygenase n=1 Tax=Streptomyces sp. L-9-10 TaxID=1478131 RepID=UPI0010EFE41A|nr:FAD-dependent monooxygenase [Streptomyces sp. L-9-10]RYJ25775.1 FAD-dependent monooxygenase [Streptomyces sp. L-9-10]